MQHQHLRLVQVSVADALSLGLMMWYAIHDRNTYPNIIFQIYVQIFMLLRFHVHMALSNRCQFFVGLALFIERFLQESGCIVIA